MGRRLVDWLTVLLARIDLQVREFWDVLRNRIGRLHLPSSHNIIIATPAIGLVIE
jgi:hypothetical protein